ncbi:MAG: hypothetical protein ACT4PJ_00490 [Gemmatimonadaceae bacterium]
MLSTFRSRRSALVMAVIGSLVVGCDEDPVQPEPEPEFERVEFTLTAGATTRVVTVNTTGTQTGTANFPAGTTSVSLAARFLKADNSVDVLVTPADFELRQGTGGSAGVTFALATGQSFSGTVSGLTNGTRTVMMQLFHKVEGHEDFQQPLTIVVGP